MKKNLIIMAAAMLTACHTQQTATADYDLRPENKQPTLVRPAWPNYDLQNDRSFAAFSNVQVAPENEGKRFHLQEESGEITYGSYTVYRCKDATYVAFDWYVPKEQDWWFFCWKEGAAIIDADTGDRYMIRRLEHFPLNQCFWIYGQGGETIRIVCVYPPLPQKVKRIQFFEPSTESRRWMDGNGSRTMPCSLAKLRPEYKPFRHHSGQGRVIY